MASGPRATPLLADALPSPAAPPRPAGETGGDAQLSKEHAQLLKSRSCERVLWATFCLALIAATALTTYLTVSSSTSSRPSPPPPKGACLRTLAFDTPYAGSQAVLGGMATFKFAFKFERQLTLVRADGGKVHRGAMHVCFETTGMHRSGPGTCVNDFVFDETTCRLSTKLSKCQIDVQHKYTDLAIQWIDYDGAADEITMDATTHMPGWPGVTRYSSKTPVDMTCPEPASNADVEATLAPTARGGLAQTLLRGPAAGRGR
jgi:hypothetical protein